MNYRNWFSKERITNNDDFCLKSPITKLDHFRLVLTHKKCLRTYISPGLIIRGLRHIKYYTVYNRLIHKIEK